MNLDEPPRRVYILPRLAVIIGNGLPYLAFTGIDTMVEYLSDQMLGPLVPCPATLLRLPRRKAGLEQQVRSPQRRKPIDPNLGNIA